ncbi:hypothetical protein PGT21_012851 [Puccinia graminis f. sp. tritici]|uniref:Uncharacterized protein n=2 Tax=Puccinia graminis f. sp. tritici TaxID=56615 RepID=E3KEC9_PUCGT|nr:uncharacterized protein PGTG_08858 [Puccinia graminis f. sp. tritici CRL 75-36-700-3]EFP82662.2 hypothetical protein PGTG_08858 [Puccinia graminis f. sp. tritici CRL 75-36-700-3]KAA1086823.1 hypothetical protein PGT21_012851 [Puccinia graminis f. sp. tritici]
MWITARKGQTVVWKLFQIGQDPARIYLMTSDGVERVVDPWTPAVVNALAKSDTVYIVDGQAPTVVKAWTLLLTSPKRKHYQKYLTKRARLLYMPPWSGVPRYVLELASFQFKALGGNEDAVFKPLVAELTQAINRGGGVIGFIKAHQNQTCEAKNSHCVLHICCHPNGKLKQLHLEWASCRVEGVVAEQVAKELHNDLEDFLHIAFNCGNLRGLLYEPYAIKVLQGGGSFQVRQLCKGNRSNTQNIKVLFPAAKCQTFQTYKEVTVSEKHPPIKHQGLSKALLELVDKSEPSDPRLYFVVPSDIYLTFTYQQYHTKDGEK